MKIYVANFGVDNFLWPSCLSTSTIAMFEDEDLWAMKEANDREGYILRCISAKKTAAGKVPTTQVASRWFNLTDIFRSTSEDIWIHREKEDIWWGTSLADPVEVSLESTATGGRIYVIRKAVAVWSKTTKTGTPLKWAALHPKARDFLFTESTFHALTKENSDYALALISGRDLTRWHSHRDWKAKEEAAGKGPTTIFDAQKRSIWRMVDTAVNTASSSNGQEIQRTLKNKEVRFASIEEFRNYLAELLEQQKGGCALTNIPLVFDGEEGDLALRCSLDRVDSNGHYERGNLQIVCTFVNRWKSDSDNNEFRRLINVVRSMNLVQASL